VANAWWRKLGAQRAVKPRHTAALGLVCWYLMVTPIGEGGRSDKTVPLNHWKHPYTFDSRHDCETALAAAHVSEAQGVASLSLRTGLSEQETTTVPFYSADWKCVGSDDPRLKGN
jgi:hypothetical protein